MDLILNELSISKVSSKEKAIEVFQELASIISILLGKGFRSLRIGDRHKILAFDFFDNFSLNVWFKQKEYSNSTEKTKSQLLKSIVTKKDAGWTHEELNILSEFPVIGIQIDLGQEISDGLKIAYVLNTISVSFNSTLLWNTHYLDLIMLIDFEGGVYEKPVYINHASTVIHLDQHSIWISNLVKAKKIQYVWNPAENLFPFRDYSNECAPESNWEKFRKTLRETFQVDKKAIIIATAKLVAERNGYSYDQKISALNKNYDHKRIIYSAGNGKRKTYLSFDLEKGGFEVCNYLGEHQGEYFFDGSLQKGPQADHGIKVN